METVITIIAGLLLLTILVVAHEFGHFFVGKKCGIRIEEFAVGFGPKIISKIKNGIRYSVRALPLGGFVQFYGEDEEKLKETNAFNNRPIWQRALTLLAGPVMNLLLALVITVAVLTIYGDYAPVVKTVTPGMSAEAAGMHAEDRIIAINDKKIDFSMEFSTAYLESGEESITISVLRNGDTLTFDMPFMFDEQGKKLIGITYANERVQFGVFEALMLSFKWLFLIIAQLFTFLGDLIFRGQGAGDVAGPVGTISVIGMAIRSGFEVVLRMAALLSINLGIMNLLPFPALDGGRLVFLGIEKLRGKPIAREKEGYINFAGLVVLFALMAVLTYQDISRLISG